MYSSDVGDMVEMALNAGTDVILLQTNNIDGCLWLPQCWTEALRPEVLRREILAGLSSSFLRLFLDRFWTKLWKTLDEKFKLYFKENNLNFSMFRETLKEI